MGELVRALLTTSRLEAGATKIKTTQVNIKKLVKRALDEFTPLISQKNLQIHTSYSNDCPETLLTDEEFFYIILQNLFSNAIRYTREQGNIHIAFSTTDHRKLMLEIKDDGYGIPKSEQPKIFTKMYRGSNIKSVDQQGSGLGLYLVQSIVKRIGGSIHFASEENKGSVFTILLPLRTAA